MVKFALKLRRYFQNFLKKSGIRRCRAAHLRLGRKGERIARHALFEYGMEYLTKNYSCKFGEIDLIFRDVDTIVFVEVKTRHRQKYFEPADAVTPSKRKNIIRSSQQYLKEIGSPKINRRYDIVEVIFDGRKLSTIRHWRDAFNEKLTKTNFDYRPHFNFNS